MPNTYNITIGKQSNVTIARFTLPESRSTGEYSA